MKKISRRKFLKKSLKSILLVSGVALGGYSYFKYIEPKWIEICKYHLKHPLIPKSFHQLKIVQFSDTHIGFHFPMEHFSKIVDQITQLEPDLLIFSGDLIDDPLSFDQYLQTEMILKQLDAPLGKYAVFGNHDHGGYGTERYSTLMERSGFQLLLNESVTVSNQGERICLIGIDDAMLGRPNLEKATRSINDNTYNILISHAPDLADQVASFPIHLQLSGHSHGGQVQLPFLGPLITPPFAEKYVEGFYEITNDFLLYVNRGLGTTRLPYRCFSRPEITIFQLQSEQ